MSTHIKSRLLFIAVMFCLFNAYVLTSVFGIVRLNDASMNPSLSEGDLVVWNRLAYRKQNVRMGDIVYLRDEEGRSVFRRVIGLPGDHIRIWGGLVIINGSVLNETYLPSDCMTNGDEEYDVPDGMYFVLADNRDHSVDSRYWTDPFIPSDSILGKAYFNVMTHHFFYPVDYRMVKEETMD